MGTRYQIEVWTNICPFGYDEGLYQYRHYWGGSSFISALWNFHKAKQAGYGCVTMHWR